MDQPMNSHQPNDYRSSASQWNPPAKRMNNMNMYPPLPNYNLDSKEVHIRPLDERVNGRQPYHEERSHQDKDALIAELKEEVNKLKKRVEEVELERDNLTALTKDQEKRLARCSSIKPIDQKSVDINAGPVSASPAEGKGPNTKPSHPKSNEHASAVSENPYAWDSDAPSSAVQRKYGQGYPKTRWESQYHDRQNYGYRYQGDPYHRPADPYYYRPPSEYGSSYPYSQHPKAWQAPHQQAYPQSGGHSYPEPEYPSTGYDRYESGYDPRANNYNQHRMWSNHEASRRYDSYPQHEESMPNPNQRGSTGAPHYAPRGNEPIDPRVHESEYERRGAAIMQNGYARAPVRNEGWDGPGPNPAGNERVVARGPRNQGGQLPGYPPRDQGVESISGHQPRDEYGQPMSGHPPREQVDQPIPNNLKRNVAMPQKNEHRQYPAASTQYQQDLYSTSPPIPPIVDHAPRSGNAPKNQNAPVSVKKELPQKEGRSERQGGVSNEGLSRPSREAQQLHPSQRGRENNPYVHQNSQNSNNKIIKPKQRQQSEQSINQRYSHQNRGQNNSGFLNNSSKNQPPPKKGGAQRFGGQNNFGKPGNSNNFAHHPSSENPSASRSPRYPPTGPNAKGSVNNHMAAKSRPPNSYPQSAKSSPPGHSGDGAMPQQKVMKGLVMGPHDPTQETVREEVKYPAKNKKRRGSGKGRGSGRGRGGRRGGGGCKW